MRNSFFFKQPEKREFKYKPRFRETEGGVKNEQGELDLDKFADRLHSRWESSRKRRGQTGQNSQRMLVIMFFIVCVLLFFFYRYFLK
ncbi:MAG: hypothetical protein LBR51_05385 [Bacteroidales bacterium]|jgi:hypothetical protein|nr:hypothetical protein [Bacteroidales bacterium]